jgi:hypothetical protein
MATNDSTTAVSPNMQSENAISAFKLRRIGRCASPPVWVCIRILIKYRFYCCQCCLQLANVMFHQGCYELDVAVSDSDSQSQSDTDGAHSCDEDEDQADGDDGKISIIITPVDPANIPLPPSPPPIIVSMESSASPASDSAQPTPALEAESNPSLNDQGSQEEGCADCDKPKLDKGKGREVLVDVPTPSTPQPTEQCTPGTPSSRKTRRSSRSSRRTPTYRPILTIRSSHGWIWNQVRLSCEINVSRLIVV